MHTSNSPHLFSPANRPPLWLYHDLTHDQWRRPEYQNLCLETVHRHCAHSFQIVQLDRYSVYRYVPDLPREVWVKCSPAQRVDLMRWELLARHGGLFLDADVLVLRDLLPVMEKLQDHDFVAFGKADGHHPHMQPKGQVQSGGDVAHVGGGRGFRTQTTPTLLDDATHQPTFPKPLTWAMASRPAGRLVMLARHRAHWIIRNDPNRLYVAPHVLGRETMWHCMGQLHQEAAARAGARGCTGHWEPWTYFHVSNVCAEQDRFGQPYTKDRLLQDGVYDEQCVANGALMVPLNSPDDGRLCGFPMWFMKASREQLLGELGETTVVGELWRRSLNTNDPSNVDLI
jgi:hypothetical protein